ncbi:MAG: thiamine-phosphate kinase [Opitutales bacterium]
MLYDPFASPSGQSHSNIAEWGECRLIRDLKQWLEPITPEAPHGMGDDCAVFEPLAGCSQILTTDSVSYGQHFDASVGPEDAGAKLIKRNLSDIAAMGGRPGPALLNLLCGPDLSLAWLERFVAGIRNTCLQYGVSIVGGDVSELAPGQFTASLSLIGTTSAAPKLRSTAGKGDLIYVTGTLGGSILGKHYAFEPRLKEGRWLALRPECTAMMDLTDGLGKDLAALIPQDCAASIQIDQLPISEDAQKMATQSGKDPAQHAFSDGEDYELLFTLSAKTNAGAFESEWRQAFPNLPIQGIGRICASHGGAPYRDAVTGEPLEWKAGFEHFLPR